MVHELVFRRPELGVAGRITPTGRVDQGLRMFDPQAHGEGFAVEGNPLIAQHGEGVAGAVPHRQHNAVAFDSTAIGQYHPLHGPTARRQLQPHHPGAEMHLPTQGLNLGAEPPYHGR